MVVSTLSNEFAISTSNVNLRFMVVHIHPRYLTAIACQQISNIFPCILTDPGAAIIWTNSILPPFCFWHNSKHTNYYRPDLDLIVPFIWGHCKRSINNKPLWIVCICTFVCIYYVVAFIRFYAQFITKIFMFIGKARKLDSSNQTTFVHLIGCTVNRVKKKDSYLNACAMRTDSLNTMDSLDRLAIKPTYYVSLFLLYGL